MVQPKPQPKIEQATRPVLLVDTWTDPEGHTNGVIRNPEDIRAVEERIQSVVHDIGTLPSKPQWDQHRELKWRLGSGTLYCTNVGLIGGIGIDMDGMWYVEDRHPRIAVRVGNLVKVKYHRRRKPEYADENGGYHCRDEAFGDD